MRFSPSLCEAEFVSRPNRFLALVRLDGKLRLAHVHDPGRLEELLYPGVRLLLRPAPPGRKTSHDVMLVRRGRVWVSIYSTLPNRLVRAALARERLPELAGYTGFRPEVRLGQSRIDFRLEAKPPVWLEVKCVTLVRNRTGLFPDAPTERGRRHVAELARLAGTNARAVVLFVVGRSDADRVRPNRATDPAFALAARAAAEQGVRFLARRCRVSRQEITLGRAIPVDLS